MSAKTEEKALVVRDKTYFKQEINAWSRLAIFGCLLGLSAPGFDQWYLAWFGLIPILFYTCKSAYPPQAFYRGLVFGYAYNLVYAIWIMQFSAVVWPENIRSLYMVANITVWILYSLQQGALVGAFCFIIRWLPLTGGILAVKDKDTGAWKVPSLVVLPIIWILIMNKLGNHPSSLAVPWTLIEYSQYKLTEFVQIASIIGGIGLSAILVMVNVLIASFIATVSKKNDISELAFPNRFSMLGSAFIVQCLVFGALSYGTIELKKAEQKKDKEIFSVLQGNVQFDLNDPNSVKHWFTYTKMAAASPPGVCIWPEWAMPVSVSAFPGVFKSMDILAKKNKQDWIVGSIDSDDDNTFYNSACFVGKSVGASPEVYRKQYLVPFGEFSPEWILKSPLGGLCGTLTPKREGYKSGGTSGLFHVGKNKIAPLICCELMSPELASKGVREGGEILVDCSNTMWFETELLGRQSFAVSALRAVENHRYFIFGTSIGPSAFIDWHGRIIKTAPVNKEYILSQEIKYDSTLTPFSRWFR